MKKYSIFLFLLFSLVSLQAQDLSSKKQTNELKWYTEIKEAITISNKQKKPLLLFFTGSDWCGWCIRLQKEVFKTPEFTKWASENVILVELDFPKRKAQPDEIKIQNNQLQQFFGVQGFPTVHISKATINDKNINIEAFGSTGYVNGGPAAWIAVADPFVKEAMKPKPKVKKE